MLWITRCLLQLGIWTDSGTEGVDKLAAIWPRPEFMRFLASSEPADGTWAELVAGRLVYLVVLMVVAVLVSFIISFYFSANTIIYSLLRNRVDKTALNDVCTHFDEADNETSATDLQPPQEQ
jgi:hypothetical protein